MGSIKALSALISSNVPSQPHLEPPPTHMGSGALFKVTLEALVPA